jgi:hypothetical protein
MGLTEPARAVFELRLVGKPGTAGIHDLRALLKRLAAARLRLRRDARGRDGRIRHKLATRMTKRRRVLPSPHSRRHIVGDEVMRPTDLGRISGCGRPSAFAQCLNLEHEIHQTVSQLCILGFEPLN